MREFVVAVIQGEAAAGEEEEVEEGAPLHVI